MGWRPNIYFLIKITITQCRIANLTEIASTLGKPNQAGLPRLYLPRLYVHGTWAYIHCLGLGTLSHLIFSAPVWDSVPLTESVSVKREREAISPILWIMKKKKLRGYVNSPRLQSQKWLESRPPVPVLCQDSHLVHSDTNPTWMKRVITIRTVRIKHWKTISNHWGD